MPAPIIDAQATLDTVLNENAYTLGKLQSHPLAAAFTPQFDAFQATWATTDAARTALIVALGKANGSVSGADDDLDDFVDTLDRTLLIATKNDRSAALYQLYFGLKPPSTFKRPILGVELDTLKDYIPSLKTSTNTALAALGTTLGTLTAAADTAVTAQKAADQALKDFDTIGGKKTLIDAFNTVRQTAYGQLAAIPHQNPSANLPATFADRFFLHTTHKGVTSLTNPVEVQAKITTIQKDLTDAQNHLANLNAAIKAKADATAAAKAAADKSTQAKQAVKAAKQAAKDAEAQAKTAKVKAKKKV